MCQQFTHVLLLTYDGRLAYHGRQDQAIKYFQNLGYVRACTSIHRLFNLSVFWLLPPVWDCVGIGPCVACTDPQPRSAQQIPTPINTKPSTRIHTSIYTYMHMQVQVPGELQPRGLLPQAHLRHARRQAGGGTSFILFDDYWWSWCFFRCHGMDVYVGTHETPVLHSSLPPITALPPSQPPKKTNTSRRRRVWTAW